MKKETFNAPEVEIVHYDEEALTTAPVTYSSGQNDEGN